AVIAGGQFVVEEWRRFSPVAEALLGYEEVPSECEEAPSEYVEVSSLLFLQFPRLLCSHPLCLSAWQSNRL
ncbi:MAG: hypothetical protein N2205_09145, partial [Candidatus Caldatribacterium sp.]|nr:hypothetical protein [Candidatus Caldatribacterium sp.]